MLLNLLGIMIIHSRETHQPTSIIRWDRVIHHGLVRYFTSKNIVIRWNFMAILTGDLMDHEVRICVVNMVISSPKLTFTSN